MFNMLSYGEVHIEYLSGVPPLDHIKWSWRGCEYISSPWHCSHYPSSTACWSGLFCWSVCILNDGVQCFSLLLWPLVFFIFSPLSHAILEVSSSLWVLWFTVWLSSTLHVDSLLQYLITVLLPLDGNGSSSQTLLSWVYFSNKQGVVSCLRLLWICVVFVWLVVGWYVVDGFACLDK